MHVKHPKTVEFFERADAIIGKFEGSPIEAKIELFIMKRIRECSCVSEFVKKRGDELRDLESMADLGDTGKWHVFDTSKKAHPT